jgi:hypothetical protein
VGALPKHEKTPFHLLGRLYKGFSPYRKITIYFLEKLQFVEKDQRIKESTINCPNKWLRRYLWVVLGGYHWRRS